LPDAAAWQREKTGGRALSRRERQDRDVFGEDDLPMTDERGNRYEIAVGKNINPEQLAAKLTVKIRDKVLGEGAGFNRKIDCDRWM
jgi:hypothetical protein